jgi:hypothetical protein
LSADTVACLSVASGDLVGAELRSAHTTSHLLTNAILAQKKRQAGRKGGSV